MCGIAAAIGIVNPRYFKRLCAEQDTRGGDGAGLYLKHPEGFSHVLAAKTLTTLVGNPSPETRRLLHFLYGVEETSSLADLAESWLDVDSNVPTTVAIGHARKASRGANVPYNIMPMIDPEGSFVFTHNGTLNNYGSIAKKFQVPYITAKHSDSYVLSEAMYYAKNTLEPLSYIHDGTTVVWYDEEIGEEVLNVFVADVTTPKPLHYLQLSGVVYISSEKTPLEFVGFAHELSTGEEYEVQCFEPGFYYMVKSHEIIKVQKIAKQYFITPTASRNVPLVPQTSEKVLDLYSKHTNRVTIFNLKYWFNGSVITTVPNPKTGEIKPLHIDHLGYLSLTGGIPMYFYDGIPVKGEAAVRHLVKMDRPDPKSIAVWAIYPLPTPTNFGPNYSKSCFFMSNTSAPYADGKYTPFGDCKTYVIANGRLTKLILPTTLQEQTSAAAEASHYIVRLSKEYDSQSRAVTETSKEPVKESLTERFIDYLLEDPVTEDDLELYDDTLKFLLKAFPNCQFYREQMSALAVEHKARRSR